MSRDPAMMYQGRFISEMRQSQVIVSQFATVNLDIADEPDAVMGNTQQPLKIAIVHDQLYTIGGAEKVLGAICGLFPDADVFSLFNLLGEDELTQLMGRRRPKTTFLQTLPALGKLRQFYFILMPLAVEQIDLRSYDLVISSSYLVAKGVITAPDQAHLCYMHSPMRYAWDQQASYLEQLRSRFGLRRLFARVLLHYMRGWDARSTNGVDLLLVNSRYVGRRVTKTYRRSSEVVYPPVAVNSFPVGVGERDPNMFVTMSRIVEGKRIDLLVDGFRLLPDCRLKIIGDGAMRAKLEKNAPSNVEFMGRLDHDKAAAIIGQASAFVFAAEEDFGLAPVEAQACGTPVIAFGSGGAMETIQDIGRFPLAPTGVFFRQQTAKDVAAAVQILRSKRALFTAEACRRNAERFDSKRFARLFLEKVNLLVSDTRKAHMIEEPAPNYARSYEPLT